MIDRAELRKAERHLKKNDRVVAGLVTAVGRCRLDEMQIERSFAGLTRTIVSQQLSVKAADTIYRRFARLLGRRRPNPKSILSKSTRQLRSVGLSRQKTSYLQDLAQKVHDGSLSLRRLRYMDDEEVIGALTQVKGIGRWTAEVYLLFRLGRLDVMPVDDLGLRDAAQLAYSLKTRPDAKKLLAISEPWRPYRSVGSWYLWMARGGGVLDDGAG